MNAYQPQYRPVAQTAAPSKPNAVAWWFAIGAALIVFFPAAIPIAYFYEKAQRSYDEHMRHMAMVAYYRQQWAKR